MTPSTTSSGTPPAARCSTVDDEIRCIVITGASGAFTAGQDLTEMLDRLSTPDGGEHRSLVHRCAGGARQALARRGLERRRRDRRDDLPTATSMTGERSNSTQGAVPPARRHDRGRRQLPAPAADGMAGGCPLHLHRRLARRRRRQVRSGVAGRPRRAAARRGDGHRSADPRDASPLGAGDEAPDGGRPARSRGAPPASGRTPPSSSWSALPDNTGSSPASSRLTVPPAAFDSSQLVEEGLLDVGDQVVGVLRAPPDETLPSAIPISARSAR